MKQTAIALLCVVAVGLLSARIIHKKNSQINHLRHRLDLASREAEHRSTNTKRNWRFNGEDLSNLLDLESLEPLGHGNEWALDEIEVVFLVDAKACNVCVEQVLGELSALNVPR